MHYSTSRPRAVKGGRDRGAPALTAKTRMYYSADPLMTYAARR